MSNPNWLELDQRHVWHPYTQMATAPLPLPIVRAEGVWLETADGRRILDGISSWWVNLHGHNHERLNRALAEQASRFAQVIFAGCTHEPAAQLAAELVQRCPAALSRVFYSDDGSTAVEVALKLAYLYWQRRGETRRRRFIALEGAYHGDTFGAMAAGGVAAFHGELGALFFHVDRVGSLDELARFLALHGDETAALILEPMIQGAAGMVFWPAAFLAEVRRMTAERGILLIADEIFTGFGRTGRFLACEHAGVAPDLLCLSKALTAGYLPLAATLAREAIYDAFLSSDRSRAFFHGHSFTGNALACAVALESLRLFDDEDCLARVRKLERLYARRLERLSTHRFVAGTRHLGAVAAIEVRSHAGGYLDELGPRLASAFLARDVLLRPLGNVIYTLPPYCIRDEELEWVFDIIEEVLETLG